MGCVVFLHSLVQSIRHDAQFMDPHHVWEWDANPVFYWTGVDDHSRPLSHPEMPRAHQIWTTPAISALGCVGPVWLMSLVVPSSGSQASSIVTPFDMKFVV